MFSRYFLVLCVVAVFAFAIHVSAVEPESAVAVQDDVRERNPLAIRVVLKLLQKAVKWAAKHCLKEAAGHCKKHWKHPKEAVRCGKNYLNANRGRCAIGK